MPMSLAETERQLDRMQAFFPRLDSKATSLFAIDSAMLAVASARFRPDHMDNWYTALPAALFVVAIVLSLGFFFVASVPNVKGGGTSLIFFGSIAPRTEGQYAAECDAASEADLLRDFRQQVWRNAQILREKYRYVRYAFIAMASSIAPWCWYLAASSFGR